jgi:hypothetical protein
MLLNRSVAMQPKKSKLALQLGALIVGASCAFGASADPFQMTVNTISDVTIATVTALDFGTNITTDPSVSCAMDASAPAGATVFADAALVAAAYGVITGGSCIGSGTTVATPGVYSITGVAGLDVTVTLSSVAQVGGDFTYTPTGCVVDHDGAAGGDVCTVYTAGTPAIVGIANASDTGGNAQSGLTHFTVGGTIATGPTGLTSDTPYTATFNVDVVY